MKNVYIIRYSNGEMQAVHETHEDAEKIAERNARDKGVSYVIA